MSLNEPRTIPDTQYTGVPLSPKPRGIVGTVASGFTVMEMGDDMRHRTIIKLTTALSIVTTPDTAALADGMLIYTFPAGQIIVHEVYGDIGLEINDATNVPDTPEVGLGTVIATGAVATLGAGAATWENIWGPHVVAGCDVGADTSDAGQWVTYPGMVILGAGVKTVYFNVADTWSNGAGTADVFFQAGRFIIDWTVIPAEGL